MTPWTWSIAYRRFYQGILIASERSRAVTVGTGVRLLANVTVLGAGLVVGEWPGIVVGASAIATGVVTEAVWVGWRVRPVLRERIAPAVPRGEPLTLGSFVRFYVPLALTPLITLVIQPIGAAAMSRMPVALGSLAAWPALHGLVFVTRSVGMAHNEVVVTLVGQPGGPRVLRRFQRLLAVATMGILALLAATPLARLWFEVFSGLSSDLVELCRVATALAVLMPGYAVLQSWYQGAMVKHGFTRPITEAVVLYMVLCTALLAAGVWLRLTPGVHWAVGSFTIAGVAQTAWLRRRSRAALERFSGGGTAAPAASARGVVDG